MDVIVCTEPGDLRLERRPRPIRAEGEVLVRIRKIGVWGTDMHIFTGNQPYLSYPRVMGHELAGKVEEAPAGSGLGPGDPAPRPRPQRISERPQAYVMKPNGITLEQAAMVEFLEIGAHAVRRGGSSRREEGAGGWRWPDRNRSCPLQQASQGKRHRARRTRGPARILL